MASINFMTEYKLQQRRMQLQMQTDMFANTQGANGQPLFPNQPGTPLNISHQRAQSAPAEQPVPCDIKLDNCATTKAQGAG